MSDAARARNYDLFKGIVALILLILIIILLLVWKPQAPATPPPVPATESPGVTLAPTFSPPPFPDSPVPLTYDPATRFLRVPAGREVYALDDSNQWAPIYPDMPEDLRIAMQNGSVIPILTGEGWALAAPDGTLMYTYNSAAQAWDPTAAALAAAQPAAQPTAAPVAPTPAPTAVPPTATPAPAVDTCQTVPVRLAPGMQARVVSSLNLRSSPGIGFNDNNWLLTNPPGTLLRIAGESQCLPFGTGAYRWWPVSMADGTAGWSAEGSFTGNGYFLEPAP